MIARRAEMQFLLPPASYSDGRRADREHGCACLASTLPPLAHSGARPALWTQHARITFKQYGTYEPIERATPRPSGSYCFEMMPHNLGSLNTPNCWGLP